MQIYNARALCGLPVKTGVARRGAARRPGFIVALVRAQRRRTVTRSGPGPTFFFRSENEWRRENGDREQVDTCRGVAPGLKCPLHYREDAADRFGHA